MAAPTPFTKRIKTMRVMKRAMGPTEIMLWEVITEITWKRPFGSTAQ
ncbi:hypothetical protein R2A130_2627 [Ahrensia sp. R2A130]|nr:hypothetical protein R2A130_2627 [Ahrensia sp. R2A130]